MFLEISQNSQENTCAKALAQMFSCEFCEISKNIFPYRAPLVAASVSYEMNWKKSIKRNLRSAKVYIERHFH